MRTWMACLIAVLVLGFAAGPAMAIDAAHKALAEERLAKGAAFLRSSQNEDGSWTPEAGPGITAMAVRSLLGVPGVTVDDPAVKKGIDYILSKAQPDGGIHGGSMENYNTAICLSTLGLVASQRADASAAVIKAQDYLRNLQWVNQADPQGKIVDEKHPFYGGAGYGKHGRPDMSNTQMMLDGLHDSGLEEKDPAFQRALVFITRCQGTSANTEFGGKIAADGGFIYSTSINKDQIGVPQSMAGEQPEPGGSRLRTYGSMTYAGFKSYLYADLPRNDPRVLDALRWIQANYTLEQNPGMPEEQKTQGLYYYYMTFARALEAWGEDQIETTAGPRDWANDLIAKLASLQKEDGSWTNEADRWMEGDPNLVTCYSMISLIHAVK